MIKNYLMNLFMAGLLLCGAATANAMSNRLFIVGDATWGGWSLSKSSLMVPNFTSDTVFVYTGWMQGNKEFKFVTDVQNGFRDRANDSGIDEYNNGAGTTGVLAGSEGSYSGTLVKNDGITDAKFILPESANYTITCNLTTNVITAVKSAYQSSPIYFNQLFLVGSATPGGWSLDNASLISQADPSGNPFLFSGNVLFSAGTFKLTADKYAGYSDQEWFFRDLSDASKITDDSSLGDNQWTISTPGLYKVTVDIAAKTISMVPTTPDKLLVIGEATFGGYTLNKAYVMLPDAGTSTTFNFTGYLDASKDFKFMCQSSYNDGFQYNSASEPTILDASGAISPITLNSTKASTDNKFQVAEAGNYTISCDLLNNTVSAMKAAYQTKPIYYNELYMVGTATAGGVSLNGGTGMVQDATNPFIFTATDSLMAGSFKIATNKYGDYSTGNDAQVWFLRDGNDATKMTNDMTADNQWEIAETAKYIVTADIENMTISIKKASGVDANRISDNVKIARVSSRTFVVNGAEGSAVNVYSTLGQLVKTIKSASASQAIEIENPGLYIIRVGAATKKVIAE
jgi:hypothetical protein